MSERDQDALLTLADAFVVIRNEVDDWLTKHTKTKRKDIPANVADNVLRALGQAGFTFTRPSAPRRCLHADPTQGGQCINLQHGEATICLLPHRYTQAGRRELPEQKPTYQQDDATSPSTGYGQVTESDR